MDDCSLGTVNADVLFNVFSFLPPILVRKEVACVNRYWNENARGTVVYVDDRIREDGKQVFSTLQRAIDVCSDYSTIIIRSSFISPVVIVNKHVEITTGGEKVIIRADTPVVFDMELSGVCLSNSFFCIENHSQVDDTEEEKGFNDACTIIRASNCNISMKDLKFDVQQANLWRCMTCSTSSIRMDNIYLKDVISVLLGSGSLSIQNCYFTDVSDEGIFLLEGPMVIQNTVLQAKRRSKKMGILFDSPCNSMVLRDAKVYGFHIGILCRGTSICQSCSVCYCEMMGICVENSDNPYLCQIENCTVDRCGRGICGGHSLLSVRSSHVRHCSPAIHADSCLAVRIENCCLHDSKNVIVKCKNVQSFQSASNSVYDGKVGYDLEKVQNVGIVHTHFMYIRDNVFSLSMSMERFHLCDNTIIMNCQHGLIQRTSMTFDVTEMEMLGNRIISDRSVEQSLLDDGDCQRIKQSIRISPIKREIGLFIEKAESQYSVKTHRFSPRIYAVPVALGVLISYIIFLRR